MTQRQETCSGKGRGGGCTPRAIRPPAPRALVQSLPVPSGLDSPPTCQETRGWVVREGSRYIQERSPAESYEDRDIAFCELGQGSPHVVTPFPPCSLTLDNLVVPSQP